MVVAQGQGTLYKLQKYITIYSFVSDKYIFYSTSCQNGYSRKTFPTVDKIVTDWSHPPKVVSILPDLISSV